MAGNLSGESDYSRMTGLNPNAMYELGISHTIGRPAIMMLQPKKAENGRFPFDISHIRAIHYNDDAAGGQILPNRLSETLDNVLVQEVAKPRRMSETVQLQIQDSLENHRNILVNEFVEALDLASN